MAKTNAKNNDITSNHGFEAKLWAAADAPRNARDSERWRPYV